MDFVCGMLLAAKRSPLMIAVSQRKTEIIKILLENGANPSLSLSSKILEEKRSFLETFEFYLGTYSLGGLSDTSLVFEENNPIDQIFKTHISHRDFDIHKINEEIYNATGRAFLKE